jgi:HAMP domain-containing protein
MNREFEKLLKEKWFLVAADLIAVMAILIAMPDKRDGLDTFLVICAILAASLIVVIPVLKDGGGKAERQAEQARLRAKLAEEIDLQRDNIRAGNEAMNRRIAEAEMTARKAAEAAAAAVAQRASTEINALKAALAELTAKVEAAAGSSEALDELTAKVEGLAGTVRALVADADEAAENAGKARAEATQAFETELKSVRDEIKKSAKSADKTADKLEAALDSLREEVAELRARPAAPAEEAEEAEVTPAASAPAPVASAATDEEDSEEEASEEEEAIEEIEEVTEDEAAPAADEPASSAAGSGTALIVNLMIGIGNKPFVRGIGPGLSRDKGVPMSFLGIGRWQWISPDPEAPATVEVWKNDQSPMGEALHLPGGEPVEVDEGHFGGV